MGPAGTSRQIDGAVMTAIPVSARPRATVELYWLPLGAGPGNALVRVSGRLYEAVAAWRAGRPRQALFHSALRVTGDGRVFTIEMAPVWSDRHLERGVVVEGSVGLRRLGRSRLFRYEVRRWRDGTIPDLEHAVGGPRPVETDAARVARLLDLVARVPAATWGLDELGAGEMWNSNSLVSWVLASSGHDVHQIVPPDGGRAPGWHAGLVVAARSAASDQGIAPDLGSRRSGEHAGHVVQRADGGSSARGPHELADGVDLRPHRP